MNSPGCPSVCLFVLSVCHTFALCFSHRIIMECSGVITIGIGDVHAKCQGKRSKDKVTKVKTNFAPFWAFSGPELRVWNHRWSQNYAKSLKWHGRGALLFVFSRSSIKFQGRVGGKSAILIWTGHFQTVILVFIHKWLWNNAQSLK